MKRVVRRHKVDNKLSRRKPRYCPECSGTMVKSGIRRGKQSWVCRSKKCKFITCYPRMR